jgi:hypothetical protein
LKKHTDRPSCYDKEESMESAQSANVASDVLQAAPHASLTPEEIAKALAHHKKHHTGDDQKAQQKAAVGKKKK